MNFKQGNFQKSLEEGLAQLKKATQPQYRSEINKIIGESYFNLKAYDKALPYLEAYKGKDGKYTNTDLYYLGYAYYKQGDYLLMVKTKLHRMLIIIWQSATSRPTKSNKLSMLFVMLLRWIFLIRLRKMLI